MNSISKILIVSAFIFVLSFASFAQEQRVRFAKGKSSVTLKGKIASGGEKSYVVGARADQCMVLSVNSPNRKISADVGGNEVVNGEMIPLRSTNDYIITLYNNGSATTFSLTISIKNYSCE
jgi:hypothetical protein